MLPDDATGSVYYGSPAHISHPPSASAREDAFFSGIGKWRRSRSRYLRGELLFYAQRRRLNRVSAHGPFNICSVWHHLCAETSVRQRLCARVPYQGMLFRTGFGTDSSLTLRMTTNGCSEWQRKGAQDGNERVLRMTEYRG